ncbi:MAG TPA: site-specific integrase [Gaiellaceae bacterium]|nr:site-specific integrase [Gaiellaceae bacterium]
MSGPLEPFASGFAAELARVGYTSDAAALQLRLMAQLSEWLERERLAVSMLTPRRVAAFVAARRVAGQKTHRSAKALVPVLEYLRRLGLAAAVAEREVTAVEALLGCYRVFLTVERGLTEGTARGYVDAVRPFLERRLDSAGELELRGLTAADVLGFVLAACPGRRRGSAKLIVTGLRSLLSFLHVEGLVDRPLAAAVPSVAAWRLAGLPRALEAEQARQLLASCDRETAAGLRDFAILTLLVRLGLRRGEVAGLALDDIDWRAGELVVRGKGSRVERLPLPTDVGEAVAAYLQHGRPHRVEGRPVFVRAKAPHRALSPGGVTQVVVAAARRAGLGPITAHRLRHTAATELLRAGAPLVEVGQLLRHRSQLTTAIYAKVDRDRLRELARPWPGGAR